MRTTDICSRTRSLARTFSRRDLVEGLGAVTALKQENLAAGHRCTAPCRGRRTRPRTRGAGRCGAWRSAASRAVGSSPAGRAGQRAHSAKGGRIRDCHRTRVVGVPHLGRTRFPRDWSRPPAISPGIPPQDARYVRRSQLHGTLDALHPAAQQPWVAPSPGQCGCPNRHAHSLAEPFVDEVRDRATRRRADPRVRSPRNFFVEGRYGERRGPYESRLVIAAAVEASSTTTNPQGSMTMLLHPAGSRQGPPPRSAYLRHSGAPTLCEVGVVAAFLTAASSRWLRSA